MVNGYYTRDHVQRVPLRCCYSHGGVLRRAMRPMRTSSASHQNPGHDHPRQTIRSLSILKFRRAISIQSIASHVHRRLAYKTHSRKATVALFSYEPFPFSRLVQLSVSCLFLFPCLHAFLCSSLIYMIYIANTLKSPVVKYQVITREGQEITVSGLS